jgi:hypothetical protein
MQEDPLTTTSETGYAVYCRLANQRSQAAYEKLQQLYHNYAHHADEIAGFKALNKAAAFAMDPDTKRRKQTAVQDQVIVQWHHSLLQGWQIQIAKRMAYSVAPDPPPRLATAEEVRAHQDLATECYGPNLHVPDSASEEEEQQPTTSYPLHCVVCNRRYHAECVPIAYRRVCRGEPWTCQECITNQYTPATLPADLRYYTVHWLPSSEPLQKYKEDPDLAPLVAEFLAQHEARQEAQASRVEAPGSQATINHSSLAKEQRLLPQMQQQGDYYPHHPNGMTSG